MIFYTSDSHFSHRNIIKYSNRPFDNIDEMNEQFIQRWNSVVKESDTIYHLGDVSFDKNPDAHISRLNGHKHLISGNHDSEVVKNSFYWESVQDYLEIIDHNTKIVMCHYPFKTWNRSHHGSINLHGHCHGSMPGTDQSLDVGVDCWDYYPINIHKIKERLKTNKPYRSEDHHQPKKK